jgi:hypothetical protein
LSAKPKETSMAQKKKAKATKVTATKVTAKPKPKKPVAPPKPTYDDVYAARIAMNKADEQVNVAGRHLNRAKTDFADAAARAALIAEAGDELVEARKVAAMANKNFKKVKKAAQ